jgi:hypothetical protein
MSGGFTMAQLIEIPRMGKRGFASAKLYLVAGDNDGDRRAVKVVELKQGLQR